MTDAPRQPGGRAGSEPLPVEELLPGLLSELAGRRRAVLTAPPGAGKSTRVPLALLADGRIGGQVLLLQPRRLAARAQARYLAGLLDEPLGETVGYQVRFERRASARTRLLVVTEGILTRRLLADPFLEGVGCVILDEFHERSLHLDLALACLKQLIEVRDDLRLLVMSATLDPGPLAAYLGGCARLDCPRRDHPLRIDYLERPDPAPLAERVRAGLVRLLTDPADDGGDLLVFLPGAGEIRRSAELLGRRGLPGSPAVLGLYGALPAAEQDRALVPGPGRRVVLATNIAETSLTVPGVSAVVDSGLVKRLHHDPASGLDRLQTGRVSQASAAQRAGRAGRLSAGRALRLWTRAEQQALQPVDPPEMHRLDLAPVVLSVLAFQPGPPERFDFFEPPPAAGLRAARALLDRLGATDASGQRLTDRGRRLVALPVHPRLGVVLEAAGRAGRIEDGALVAALLAEPDPLEPGGEPASGDSDLLLRFERMRRFADRGAEAARAREQGLRPGAARAVDRARRQLARLARRAVRGRSGPPAERDPDDERAIRRMVLAGFPDRVCRRRRPGEPRARMVGGRGVRLVPESCVRRAELFVALVADAGPRGGPGPAGAAEALVRQAQAIDEGDLEAVFPGRIVETEEAVFDPGRRAVVGLLTRRFDDLLLAEQPGLALPPGQAAGVLAEAAGPRFAEVFQPDPAARRLLARLRFAARALPEHPWPDTSPEGLARLLPELCAGRRSFEDLARVDWAAELLGRLSHPLRRLLETELPERLLVPSGRRVAIDYQAAEGPAGAPVLAVRLQELFGLADTPRIASGRVGLLLHLLAPNGRPVQVTADLKSFWDQTYPQVRRDLRGRYPKHPWPEDPWEARPTSRPKRRK